MVYCLKKYFSFLFIVLLILFCRNSYVFCQYYTAGIDPASVKWRQINTPHFKLIYPLTFQKHAQYIANGLEYVYVPAASTIHLNAARMPVILHNQTTVPSSVTPYAPRRMDYFTAPPQDMYPQDWVDQLIIHEFRHAAQFSAINHGFTKGLSYLLGEQGIFAVLGIFVPLWFTEGDATVAETALHYTGRGRTPSFEMRLRTQFIQKGIYSYEKANGGSFKDFIPGKYELGYQLVGMARDKFGPTLWSNILPEVGRHPYTLIPFSSALKKQTGLNKFNLYDSLTTELRKTWQKQDKTIHENDYEPLTINTDKEYINYILPRLFRDSLLIAVKSSLDDLTKVVLIKDNGNEEELFKTGVNFLNESLTLSDSNLYWSEMGNDPRWSFRDYRIIKSYNFYSGKIKQITHRTRYYAPTVTKDGKYLAAVEVTIDNRYFLVILNAKDGSLITRINTPDNLLFIHPCWSDDGKSIVSVVFGKEGNSLSIIDPLTSQIEFLLPFTFMEIKRPSFCENFIIYNASYNGIDNIYALNRSTREVASVTSARFGATDAFALNDNSAIIYSNYTADGYRIVKEMLNPAIWKKISVPAKSAFPLAEKLTLQENFIFNSDSVPKKIYASKPYKKSLNLFNFHSWAPLGVDIQNITTKPGVTLMSQNLLGTNITIFGYQFDMNQVTSRYYLSMTNESFYPAIDLNMDYGGRRDVQVNSLNDTIPVKWNEFNISTDFRLPLKWNHSFWTQSLQPSAGLNYKNLKMDENIPLQFTHDQIIATRYSLQIKNMMKMSIRDLYPRWGQQLQLNWDNTPFEEGNNSIFTGQLTLDFPGILKHHGLRLYSGYQKKNEEYYSFSDYIVLPRGYEEIFSNEIVSLSAYYAMPLFSPDWQIGHIIYFKRFKTGIFYDCAKSTDQTLPDFFSSVGIDITSDFTLFNFIAPLDAGIRSIYIPETGKMKFQFLITVNINSIY